MPSANTLVRWANENAFAFIVQARPFPTFGRPVHLRGSPHRLQPGTSSHALRIPPRDGHPALRKTAGIGSRSTLAVSSFRLRARLGFSIPASSFRPARHYPRVRIWRSSFERQRDFNPPDQRAAQRTLWPLLTSPPLSCCIAAAVVRCERTRTKISSGKTRLLLADPSDLPRSVPNDLWAYPSVAG